MDSNSPETKAQINFFLSKSPWSQCVPTTIEKQLIDWVRSLALAALGGKVEAEISKLRWEARAQRRKPGLGSSGWRGGGRRGTDSVRDVGESASRRQDE